MLDAALAPDPIRETFRLRAVGAVERWAREASTEALADALAAPTDTGALARAAAAEAGTEALRHFEPLAAAIARGAEVRARLVEDAGGLLSAEAVGRLLGITRAAVDKRRGTGRLLAVRLRSDWAYPAIQFQDGEVIEGLADLLVSLPDLTPWAMLAMLLAPDDALAGRTPVAALRAGELAAVRRLAAAREVDAFG